MAARAERMISLDSYHDNYLSSSNAARVCLNPGGFGKLRELRWRSAVLDGSARFLKDSLRFRVDYARDLGQSEQARLEGDLRTSKRDFAPRKHHPWARSIGGPDAPPAGCRACAAARGVARSTCVNSLSGRPYRLVVVICGWIAYGGRTPTPVVSRLGLFERRQSGPAESNSFSSNELATGTRNRTLRQVP